MLWFFLFVTTVTTVNAYNKQYILNCLQYTNPYQAISTADNLLRKTDVCLSRVYVVFPPEYRAEMTEKIEECIADIRETEKSKPEYYAIQKSIGEISANVGSSIVDSQHTVEQLVVCADPLKRITNIDVYEETRFETIKDSFISNMQHADTRIHQSLNIISDQTKDIEDKLQTYFIQYHTWINMTKIRQEKAQQCQQDIKEISEKIFKHIIRGSNS